MEMIPFDDRDGVIWYNGQFVPWREAKVHVLNHGLHYASCVFEGERVYDHQVFKLQEHTERLRVSANLLGFDLPYSIDTLNQATREVVAAQKVANGYVRPFAWRGSEKMAISAQDNRIHVAIAAWPWPPYYSDEARKAGLKLTIADWVRPAPNSAPTASKAAGLYMICTISKHKAEAAGYNDALMMDYRGYIAEATSANVFFVFNGELHTPIADCFLNGITRQTVMSLAKKLGIKVVERHILPDELSKVSEGFLTGTAAEITPIRSIAHYEFSLGKITQQLMDAYRDLVHTKVAS